MSCVAHNPQARFNASELLTRREQVSREIRNGLVERAKDFHLILDDVSLVCASLFSLKYRPFPSLSTPLSISLGFTQTHIGFGKEYTAAVEAKQVGL